MAGRPGNRDKILICAKELFYHVGYQATSVDDILRKCGVAKSNFYYHFKTKEQLGLEVLDLRIDEYEGQILGPLYDLSLTPPVRIGQFFEQVCYVQSQIQRMSGCPFGNFAAALPTLEGDERPEKFRMRLSELFLKVEAALQSCLSDGQQRGEFRDDIAPEEMGAFVVAVVQGLLILTKTHRNAGSLITGLSVVRKLLQGK